MLVVLFALYQSKKIDILSEFFQALHIWPFGWQQISVVKAPDVELFSQFLTADPHFDIVSDHEQTCTLK